MENKRLIISVGAPVSGGSGTVESVTGVYVDNTDPSNPIITAQDSDTVENKSTIVSGDNVTQALENLKNSIEQPSKTYKLSFDGAKSQKISTISGLPSSVSILRAVFKVNNFPLSNSNNVFLWGTFRIGYFGGSIIVGQGSGWDNYDVGDINGAEVEVTYDQTTFDTTLRYNGVLQTSTGTTGTKSANNSLANINFPSLVGSNSIEIENLTLYDDQTLIANWQLNEGEGNIIKDSSENNHDGVIDAGTGTISEMWIETSNNADLSKTLNVILAGQSNAVGRNDETEGQPADLPSNGQIPNCNYFATDNTFKPYTLNMNYVNDNVGGWGVEYRLSKLITENLGYNINLLKYAEGGSAIGGGGRWSYPSGQLTTGLINTVNTSNTEYDVMLWVQGENDSTSQALADAYYDNLKGFIDYIRSQINRNMLFIVVRLYDFPSVNVSPYLPTSQQAQDDVRRDVYEVIEIHPQENASLKGDNIHYDATGIDNLAKEVYKSLKRYI